MSMMDGLPETGEVGVDNGLVESFSLCQARKLKNYWKDWGR